MLQLQLTHEQVQAIERVLLDATLNAEPGQAEQLRDLHREFVKARQAAARQVQCANCGKWFTASRSRRQALYCSPSCKQAAYRQRVRDRKRHMGPNRENT